MSKYINGIGIALAEAVYIDLICVLNNNTINSERIVVTPDTLRLMHNQIGQAIEAIDKQKADLKKAN